MSAIEHFESIDSKLAEIRRSYEAEIQVLKDQLQAAHVELAIRTKLHDVAVEARAEAERGIAALLTQFGTVSAVFDEAKQYALKHMQKGTPSAEATAAIETATATQLPENNL